MFQNSSSEHWLHVCLQNMIDPVEANLKYYLYKYDAKDSPIEIHGVRNSKTNKIQTLNEDLVFTSPSQIKKWWVGFLEDMCSPGHTEPLNIGFEGGSRWWDKWGCKDAQIFWVINKSIGMDFIKPRPILMKQASCKIKQSNIQFEKLCPICKYRLIRIKAQRPNLEFIIFFFQISKNFTVYS